MATTDVVPQESSGHLGQKTHRQRHEYPSRDGERLRIAKLEHGSVAQHFPNGSASFRQESVSLQHRWTADLVHDPGQQRWLHRAQKGN